LGHWVIGNECGVKNVVNTAPPGGIERIDHICHIDHIQKSVPNTPLRPHILAAFLPWGGFAGAGRPARRKGRKLQVENYKFRVKSYKI
jgi:hypothetical protein